MEEPSIKSVGLESDDKRWQKVHLYRCHWSLHISLIPVHSDINPTFLLDHSPHHSPPFSSIYLSVWLIPASTPCAFWAADGRAGGSGTGDLDAHRTQSHGSGSASAGRAAHSTSASRLASQVHTVLSLHPRKSVSLHVLRYKWPLPTFELLLQASLVILHSASHPQFSQIMNSQIKRINLSKSSSTSNACTLISCTL